MSEGQDPFADAQHVGVVPAKLPKKLIVCCDGTWQDSDNNPANPTNVTRIARAVKDLDDDHHQQIVYYQAGVGTGIGITDYLLGGGTGLGLAEHIREAYSFLVSNYADHDDLVPPDNIYLLGFSRGAFTARSIGGLVGAVGLLRTKAMSFFLRIFQDWENAGRKGYRTQFFEAYFPNPEERAKYQPDYELAHTPGAENIDKYMAAYRRQLLILNLTQEVKIKCIGVWDTVGSLGIPVNPLLQRILPFLPSYFREYAWFDTGIGNHVDYGFQALGLDERRAPFSPALWESPEGCGCYVKQVWFPGAHSNIGGSYDDTGTADITIAWMMDRLAGHDLPEGTEFEAADWIKFDDDALEDYYDERVKRYDQAFKARANFDTFRGWGLGTVYDSFTFPQSLLGKRVRTPGKYHRISYQTGKADPHTPLRNTNEFIHASVRARIDLQGGRAPEPDWTQAFPHGWNLKPWGEWLWYHLRHPTAGRFWPPYRPCARGQPLHGWELQDSHPSHKHAGADAEFSTEPATKPRWVWTGPERLGATVLPEDRLGRYELRLLVKDKDRDRIEVDDAGWVRRIWKETTRDLTRAMTY